MAYKRSTFLINKPFQLRFCLYVCSWLFVLSLLFPWLIQIVFDQFLRYVSLDPMGPELSRVQAVRSDMMGLLISAEAFFLLMTFAISVFVSHRIAGPLFKLDRFLRDQSNGKLTRLVSFRKADHFQELAESYNQMIGSLNQRVSQAIQEIEKGRPQEAATILKSLQNSDSPPRSG